MLLTPVSGAKRTIALARPGADDGIAAIRRHFVDFDRYIGAENDGPLGVAVSGGGDSVALLYALSMWGRRRLEVFCVDHGLNPLSPVWTQSVAEHALRCGAGFTALAWTGDKPKAGLAAAARQARHRLLANAARAQGIAVMCLAHTADDIAEAEDMRSEGSNVGTPQIWGPSPVWPEGRGIFLYRPFLDVRRETLRFFLRGLNISWIDDPANDNPHSLRARVRGLRAALIQGESEGEGVPRAAPHLSQKESYLAQKEVASLLRTPDSFVQRGMIAFEADAFFSLADKPADDLLAAAAVCAGGGQRLPRRDAVTAIRRGLAAGKVFTLCGARIVLRQGVVEIVRQAGDMRRKGPSQLSVAAGGNFVWDGRFAFQVTEACDIDMADGHRAALSVEDQALLASLPPAMRPGLPVMRGIGVKWRLAGDCDATCLVLPRFLAATGRFHRENDLVSGAGTEVARTV